MTGIRAKSQYCMVLPIRIQLVTEYSCLYTLNFFMLRYEVIIVLDFLQSLFINFVVENNE